MKMNKKGFTLIELIVTIAIISLILVFTIYGVNSVIESSKNKRELISISSIKKSARIYATESNSSSWHKYDDKHDFLCTTVGTLKNKGIINKNSLLPETITDESFLIVKRNNITFEIEKEEITNQDDYNKCTGQIINPIEELTKPVIKSFTNKTDKISLTIEEGTASLNEKPLKVKYECLYGKTEDAINIPGEFDNNTKTCTIDSLKNNTNYTVYIYMITENGSKVLANGNKKYKTNDFNNTSISSNGSIVDIKYNKFDTDGNFVDGFTRYFMTDKDINIPFNVKSCTSKNNSFICNDSTNQIKKNIWYKVEEDNVKLDYNNNSNLIIKTRVYDKSGNYLENSKSLNLVSDSTPPTINIYNPSNGGWTKDNVNLTITFSDNRGGAGINPNSLQKSENDISYSSVSNTSQKEYSEIFSEQQSKTIYYKICDNNNNCSTASTQINIDTTPPKIKVTNPNICGGSFQYDSLSCDLSYSDLGGSEIDKNSLSYKKGKGAKNFINPSSSSSYKDYWYEIGKYNVTYEVCDNANNCSSVTRNIKLKESLPDPEPDPDPYPPDPDPYPPDPDPYPESRPEDFPVEEPLYNCYHLRYTNCNSFYWGPSTESGKYGCLTGNQTLRDEGNGWYYHPKINCYTEAVNVGSKVGSGPCGKFSCSMGGTYTGDTTVNGKRYRICATSVSDVTGEAINGYLVPA